MKFRFSQSAEPIWRKLIKTIFSLGIVRTTIVTCASGLTAVLLVPSSALAVCNVTFSPGDNLPATVSAKPSGTTFCFNPGTYRMTTYITPKDNDVFTGSPGAILNGSALVTAWTPSGAYWVASNQPQLIPQTTGIVCMVTTSAACQFSDALFMDNTPLNRVMSLSEVVPGTFYRDYASSQIYIGQNPTGHTLEVIVCRHPILEVQTGVNGVTIEGLTIEKFAGDVGGAVQGNSTWIIQNNEVLLNHGIGIDTNGSVLGNYVHNNGDSGIGGGYASTGMVVANNEIAFNNWAGFQTAGGAWFSYTTNLVVNTNYSHDNNGPGFHADTDNLNALFENNHTKNNKNSGIDYEVSWNAIIRNNLIEEETAVTPNVTNPTSIWSHNGISVLNSSNVQIYDNTISNSTNGIAGVLGPNRGNSTHGPNTGQPYLLKNLDVHDNTLVQISNNAAGIVKADSFDNSVYESWDNHFTGDTYELSAPKGLNFTWKNSLYNWSQWQSFGNDVSGAMQSVASNGPSVPSNLSATAISSSQINLVWTASTDNAGVTGYKIYREGNQIGTSASSGYSDSGLAGGTTYTYTVSAFDASGNTSAQSVSASAITSGSSTDPLTTDLMGYWKFDATSGTVAVDSSGNGNPGTLVGPPTWTTGYIGGGLSFNGLNDRVTVGGANMVFGDSSFSGFAWVKSSDTTAQQARIMGKDFGAHGYIWLDFGGGTPYLEAKDSDLQLWTVRASTAIKIADNEWHHVGFVINRALGQSAIYIDGVLQGSRSVASTGIFGNTSATNPFDIGSQGNSSYESLNGALDEVRLYDRALSASDVVALYQWKQ